jgi:hypothetical protein
MKIVTTTIKTCQLKIILHQKNRNYLILLVILSVKELIILTADNTLVGEVIIIITTTTITTLLTITSMRHLVLHIRRAFLEVVIVT